MATMINEVGLATALGAKTEVGSEERRLALQGAPPVLGQALEVSGSEQALEEVKWAMEGWLAMEKMATKERQEQS